MKGRRNEADVTVSSEGKTNVDLEQEGISSRASVTASGDEVMVNARQSPGAETTTGSGTSLVEAVVDGEYFTQFQTGGFSYAELTSVVPRTGAFARYH
jgi:hypothetical protein